MLETYLVNDVHLILMFVLPYILGFLIPVIMMKKTISFRRLLDMTLFFFLIGLCLTLVFILSLVNDVFVAIPPNVWESLFG